MKWVCLSAVLLLRAPYSSLWRWNLKGSRLQLKKLTGANCSDAMIDEPLVGWSWKRTWEFFKAVTRLCSWLTWQRTMFWRQKWGLGLPSLESMAIGLKIRAWWCFWKSNYLKYTSCEGKRLLMQFQLHLASCSLASVCGGLFTAIHQRSFPNECLPHFPSQKEIQMAKMVLSSKPSNVLWTWSHTPKQQEAEASDLWTF